MTLSVGIHQQLQAFTSWTLLSIPLSLLVSALLVRDFVTWWRLRHVPGPFLNSISTLVLMRQIFYQKSAFYFTELSDQYGPLVHISPGEVMLTDHEAFRHINGLRSEFKRGPFFTAFRFIPNRDNIFSIQNDAYHKTHRARLTPGYVGRENDGYDVYIDRQLTRLWDLMERKYVATAVESRRVMDLNAISHYFPLDVIGDVALGQHFGYLDEGEDLYRFVTVNAKFFIYAVTLACQPWMISLLQKWPLRLLMPSDADVSGFGRIISVATNIIDQRLQPWAQPNRDILQAFIKAGLSRDELIQESIVQIVAGTDTIGSAIRMTIACLLSRPDAYRRLVDEIDTSNASGALSSPATFDECRALPYLQSVLNEAMRLYPPLTALAYKEVPAGGRTVAGYFLPAGTQVGQNIYGILRNKEYWGPDADIFLPERWLDASSSSARDMGALLDLTFGHGKFKCLGRQLALNEVNKFIVEFMRRYDFAVASVHDPPEIGASFSWPAERFLLRVTARERQTKAPFTGSDNSPKSEGERNST